MDCITCKLKITPHRKPYGGFICGKDHAQCIECDAKAQNHCALCLNRTYFVYMKFGAPPSPRSESGLTCSCPTFSIEPHINSAKFAFAREPISFRTNCYENMRHTMEVPLETPKKGEKNLTAMKPPATVEMREPQVDMKEETFFVGDTLASNFSLVYPAKLSVEQQMWSRNCGGGDNDLAAMQIVMGCQKHPRNSVLCQSHQHKSMSSGQTESEANLSTNTQEEEFSDVTPRYSLSDSTMQTVVIHDTLTRAQCCGEQGPQNPTSAIKMHTFSEDLVPDHLAPPDNPSIERYIGQYLKEYGPGVYANSPAHPERRDKPDNKPYQPDVQHKSVSTDSAPRLIPSVKQPRTLLSISRVHPIHNFSSCTLCMQPKRMCPCTILPPIRSVQVREGAATITRTSVGCVNDDSIGNTKTKERYKRPPRPLNQSSTIFDKKTLATCPVYQTPVILLNDLEMVLNDLCCPESHCQRIMHFRDFAKHLICDHVHVPMELLAPREHRNFYLDKVLPPHGVCKINCIYMLEGRITGMMDNEYNNLLPLLVMSTHIKLRRYHIQRSKVQEERYLMVWICGLVHRMLPITVSFTVCSRRRGIPDSHLIQTCGLYDIHQSRNLIDIKESNKTLLLSEKRFDELTNGGKERLQMQIFVH